MDLLGSCSCLKAFWLRATPAWGSHSNMRLFEYGGFPPLWSLNTENDDNKPSTIWASLFWVETSVWGAGLFHCLFSILQSALWLFFCTFGFKYVSTIEAHPANQYTTLMFFFVFSRKWDDPNHAYESFVYQSILHCRLTGPFLGMGGNHQPIQWTVYDVLMMFSFDSTPVSIKFPNTTKISPT